MFTSYYVFYLIFLSVLQSIIVFLTIKLCFWIEEQINNKKAD